jgi:hypothetical protein
MSAHTPGPWRFSSDGHIVSASTGERVCTPHSTLLGGKVSDQIKDLKRNARLIAAAPELLEALDKIACFAPGNGDVCEIIAKVARAAIAKATGGAS